MSSGVDTPTEPAAPAARTRVPRVPHFLRPPQPHDWRWVVGGIGKALITLGLLMFAFVGYQLWGTGIATAREQDHLSSEFDKLMAATTTMPTTAPTTTDPAATTTTSTIPTAPSTPPLDGGAAVARLVIPKIHLDWIVVEGVSKDDLTKGPGHFRETPMPGQLGNAAIAGHRTTHGHPFLDLDQLQPGDLIQLTTGAGNFTYQVTESFDVAPSDYAAAIPTTDPTVATLTLATCTPAYVSSRRLIVKAVLLPEQSSPVMAPPSNTQPPASDGSLPGDGPDTSDAVTDTITTGTDRVTDTTAPAAAAEQPIDDGFNGGWFDDTDAILPSIAWGLGLLGVGVGAYFVGRSAKRLYVSFLVGAVPFVIVLYFFFENVYRLLPPGL